jgi:ribose/xylose/arabinose/galactoside ABC-type transport system permease subunit
LQGGPVIALLLLGLYLTLATPNFLTESNISNVLRRTSVIAILAIGQTFVILSAGIDLSVGSTSALAASTSAVLMTQPIRIGDFTLGPIDFLPGVFVALGVGALAGQDRRGPSTHQPAPQGHTAATSPAAVRPACEHRR